jgi:CubicO group peptidase (beta-lactamase class C family)
VKPFRRKTNRYNVIKNKLNNLLTFFRRRNKMNIQGICEPEFGPVKAAFEGNFKESGEVGARVAVIRDGETMVDLCGGHTTEARDVGWGPDTLVCCMSVAKGVTALATHLLADRGLLEYDAPVARYWPEFAQNGKENLTVRQALSHRTSLGIIEAAEPGDILNWDAFTKKIAAQAPNWEPNTNETYHSVTFGFIVGEIVRRIDGRPIQQFIAEELAGPLGADYIIGCTDEDLARVVSQIFNSENDLMSGDLINEKTLPLFSSLPADPLFMGSPEFLKAVIPSASGVSNALGIAKLFAPVACGGEYNGQKLFKPETIKAMSEEQWHHQDYLFGNDFRVALGLLLNIPFNYFGREGNVGSAGAGGYTVFADPENRISFGYTPNRFTTGAGMGLESQRLVDALYSCL